MNPTSTFDISVTPRVGPLWQRRRIHISGAVPGAVVTVRSRTDRNGDEWTAQASFLADAEGNIDLGLQAPVSGDYRCADAMGLFWSQCRESGGSGNPEPVDVRTPITTELSAWQEADTGYLDMAGPAPDGQQEQRVTVEQWLLAEDTQRIEVRCHDLVGTLFRPAGEAAFPTVIVMNGSGGGINETRAAQYASRGIQAFALGYFRAPGLSNYISRTPLEYFERALDYVAAELSPRGGKPVVSGQSRGGELTLLLASRFPDKIAGAAAFVPGAFVFGAQGAADPADGWNGPTWTWRGEPLPHFWDNNSGVTWQPWSSDAAPSRHADVYIDGLHDRRLAMQSRIPIEQFKGPVACVSGMDDRAWPSSMASRMVMSTLERHGHVAERLHLDYESAGHGIGTPFLPSTNIQVLHPVSKVAYSNGGTPPGNARASENSFEEICAFIDRCTKA
ncbi:MAG: acyl-CoA thioesterase/BAAT N-terminal domain-containing protein [Rhodoferax sp.]|nr:acyl-CoA thioesterase/BAAT N-terminal domain-containing protein [Rhodoferax sp.]MCB2044267.1 acyl-CoA thioesterase/BAAT N-terminal domain-containing protein [Rhodoferax sp.]MCB9122890.1 acyl-CoA thioesterase/BAAT N-terminal domain-containing protein [Caldilineaceae bacterium]